MDSVVSQLLKMRDSGEDSEPGQELIERGVIEVAGKVSEESFQTFEALKGESLFIAVDGGSATILDGGSFLVAGLRVGQVAYLGKKHDRKLSGSPDMHVIALYLARLKMIYSLFYSKTVGGQPPDCPRTLDEAVGRLRTLMEWQQVEKALSGEMPDGSLVAFDGALWAGIKGINSMLTRLVEKASEKKIMLCGISKRSMLTYRSRPLIPEVQMLGESKHLNDAWFVPLEIKGYEEKLFGRVFLAKLHPRSKHVFRVDLALPEGFKPADAFGRLAALSNDATYVGYPYPLARAHNEVAFSASEIEDLRHVLKVKALEKGMSAKEWQLTFQNFHDVLDRSR